MLLDDPFFALFVPVILLSIPPALSSVAAQASLERGLGEDDANTGASTIEVFEQVVQDAEEHSADHPA